MPKVETYVPPPQQGMPHAADLQKQAVKATPDPTFDAPTKDYAPDPTRQERTSFGLNEGDQQ